MSYETLELTKEGGVCLLSLNRPDRYNAINQQMIKDLEAAMDEIEADDDIRSVILKGNGKSFCVGADLQEMVGQVGQKKPPRYSFFNKLEDLNRPVIAVIQGHCNGGGLEMAMCCDFRLVAEDAKMGLGEVKLGVIPLGGGTARLPRLIGVSRAKEFLYFGNRIDGIEANRIGLANKVVPADDLMAEAMNWAGELSAIAPLSLQALKSCVNQGVQMDLMGAIDYEARCGSFLVRTEDHKEGIMAFMEKRAPVFKAK